MASSGDYLGFVVIAVGAIPALLAIGGTGCFGHGVPTAEAVTGSRGKAVNVRITAAAGMGSIALLGAGGGSDHGIILMDMVDGGQSNGVGCAANRTGVNTDTSFGFGGLLDDNTLVPSMTSCGGVAVNVAVTTGTGVGSIALFGTGGGSYYGSIGVAGGSDCLGFVVVAVGAIPALLTIGGTGGFLNNIPVTEAVAGGGDVRIYVRITTVAGMGGVTLLGAGGLGNYRFVLMTACGNRSGFAVVAVLAVTLLRAVGGTGGGGDGVPFAVAVAGGGNVGIYVGIAAMAGTGGVTLLGAGGLGDFRHIVVNMVDGRQGDLIGSAADCTGIHTDAGLELGGFLGHDTCIPLMASGGDVRIYVAVAAVAGMGGVTLLSTGGSGNYRFVLMTGCGNRSGFAVVAILAVTLLCAVGGTGGGGNGVPCAVAVAGGGAYIRYRFFFAAERTSTRLSAVSSTSSVAVRGIIRGKGMGGILPAAAVRPGIGCIAIVTGGGFGAVGDTGRVFVADILRKGVAQRIHIAVHIAVAAVQAGMGGIALIFTGGIRNHGLIAVANGWDALIVGGGFGHTIGLEGLSAAVADEVQVVAGGLAARCHRGDLRLTAVAAGDRDGAGGSLAAVGCGDSNGGGACLQGSNLADSIHSGNG